MDTRGKPAQDGFYRLKSAFGPARHGLADLRGRPYLSRRMRMPVLQRLALMLTAIAFVLAGVLPNFAPAMSMPVAKPCADCPAKAPGAKHPGMVCCAPACIGAVAMPAPPPVFLPAFERLAYAPSPMPPTAGKPPAPDPLPPRPAAIV